MPAALVCLDRVDKSFNNGVTALQGVSLTLAAHEFITLLGPSGCGKSTVLRLVAGLDAPSAGRVESPAAGGAGAADTAYVFQEPTLMPWASLFDNVWLPLRLAGMSRRDAAEPVRAVLHTVGLSDFESAYPGELSGGMKMRASIARALVTRPRLLLMDEPFAALDEITRQKLNPDLLDWWRAQQLAALFVTHSVFEAVFLSQRVLVMGPRPGRIVAELAIDAPYPRSAEFRVSSAYAQACRALSLALESAQAGSDVASR